MLTIYQKVGNPCQLCLLATVNLTAHLAEATYYQSCFWQSVSKRRTHHNVEINAYGRAKSHCKSAVDSSYHETYQIVSCGRHGGLMVSALSSGASGPGSSPGQGHCVVFLGKTLYSHSASLHPGV